MQFDKPMIDLVREIRRRVPAETKPGIKLANTDLLDELIEHYGESADTICKALIRDLFRMAGDDWSLRLERSERGTEAFRARVYRGLTEWQMTEKTELPAADKPRRIYRGRVVA